MAEYKNEEPCEFIYNITAIEKVVDGDTIDAVIDLGFDVRYCGRIRLLGIDTPESRTKDLEEKFYGKLSSAALKSWLHWAIVSDRNDIEVQVRCPEADSRGKFGRILGELWINCTADGEEFSGWTNLNKWMCESGYAVGYHGGSKEEVEAEHMKNREILKEQKGISYPV
jgi:micrococcal nuclease